VPRRPKPPPPSRLRRVGLVAGDDDHELLRRLGFLRERVRERGGGRRATRQPHERGSTAAQPTDILNDKTGYGQRTGGHMVKGRANKWSTDERTAPRLGRARARPDPSWTACVRASSVHAQGGCMCCISYTVIYIFVYIIICISYISSYLFVYQRMQSKLRDARRDGKSIQTAGREQQC
jgi:hypothetical protein